VVQAHATSGSKFSLGRIVSSAFEATAPDTDRDKQKRKLTKRYKLMGLIF
jgi:hypothetical protein